MSIFQNKHVQIAMVLAPVLGVVSYFVTRDLGGETPHAAEMGQSYQLVEKPNCRRASGVCGLKNGDFELKLRTEWLDDDRRRLMLSSVFPLEGVMVALIENEADAISLVREMDPADKVWNEYWRVCARIFVDEEHLTNLYKTLPPKHPLEHQLLEKISRFFLIEE